MAPTWWKSNQHDCRHFHEPSADRRRFVYLCIQHRCVKGDIALAPTNQSGPPYTVQYRRVETYQFEKLLGCYRLHGVQDGGTGMWRAPRSSLSATTSDHSIDSMRLCCTTPAPSDRQASPGRTMDLPRWIEALRALECPYRARPEMAADKVCCSGLATDQRSQQQLHRLGRAVAVPTNKILVR